MTFKVMSWKFMPLFAIWFWFVKFRNHNWPVKVRVEITFYFSEEYITTM